VAAAVVLLDRFMDTDAAYTALCRPAPDAWLRVPILWRYELDPRPVVPQLRKEAQEASSKELRSIIEGIIARIQGAP
jgi:hypothetical protein